jgi:membrane protease YdiL (CAAX protease family)
MNSEFGSDDEILPVEPVDEFIPSAAAYEPPRRVWTVFVAFLTVLVGMLAAQIVAVVLVMIWYAAQGANLQQIAKELPAKLSAPVPFMLLAGLGQVVVLFGALIPARFSPEPARFRLGLVRPSLPAWGYPLLALGTIFPFAVGLVPAYFVAKLMGGPNEAVANLYQNMTWQLAVPFILFIAVVPGITEELFFRRLPATSPAAALAGMACHPGCFDSVRAHASGPAASDVRFPDRPLAWCGCLAHRLGVARHALPCIPQWRLEYLSNQQPLEGSAG